MTDPVQPDEKVWRSYQLDLDLYKFYLDLVVKVAGFFFAIAGGVIAYCLAHYHENRMVLGALFLPASLGIALSALCLKGVSGAKELDRTHEEASTELDIRSPFDLSFLTYVLRLFIWVFIVVALTTIALFFWLITNPQPPPT